MHKIYALWSHPRSMSTAMERIMRERGDLDCAHEPFMYDYYINRGVRVMPHFDVQDDHPKSYAAIRDMLLARADKQPVFIKDMSYYVMPHILKDEIFCDRLVNLFLIRNPVASILSYFKLDPDVTSDEIGIEQQWRHYQALVDRGQTPCVIEAEAVRQDPRKTLASVWKQIGLPNIPAAFDWHLGPPKDWKQVENWHADVGRSNGIRPLTLEDLNKQDTAFFGMAQKEPKLLNLLEHHAPYYFRLKAQAVFQAC